MSAGQFEFDRYINGVLMAEGVTIERQTSFEDAARVAARIASRGPNGEVPVLVLRVAALTAAGFSIVHKDEIHAPSVAELPETRGPYDAVVCKDVPADCCDYGVISLSEGREVCRVWREQDARAIAAALRELMKEVGRG